MAKWLSPGLVCTEVRMGERGDEVRSRRPQAKPLRRFSARSSVTIVSDQGHVDNRRKARESH